MPQHILGLEGWRWVVIAGAVCSLIIWLVRKTCRNPPAGWPSRDGMKTPMP